MSSKSDTGEATEYDMADEAALEAAADAGWQAYEGGDEAGPGGGGGGGGGGPQPSRLIITGQVEWSGVTDRSRGGVRTIRLDGLALDGARKALDAARKANSRAATARPAARYTAVGWHAQVRALTEHAYGSAAADRAGLSVTPRTLLAWLAEERTPSAANQAKIAGAYDAMRNRRVTESSSAARAANHAVAEAINEAIRQRYGAEVRIRDITRFTLG